MDTRRQFSFTPSGKDYFRVWARDLVLTIVTLGIYSAWAKVNRNRFFLQGTRLDGYAFDYHASPFAIFKGRILLTVFLVATSVLQEAGTQGQLAGTFLFCIAYPWAAAQANRFRGSNTSYRSIRFSSKTTLTEAYRLLLAPSLFIGVGVMVCFSLVRLSMGDGAATWIFLYQLPAVLRLYELLFEVFVLEQFASR